MASSFSSNYPVGGSGGSIFGVGDVDGKGGVGHSTTHLYSHTFDFLLDEGNFVSSHSNDYSSMNYNNKFRSFSPLSQIKDDPFIALMVVIYYMLVIGKPTSPPRKLV